MLVIMSCVAACRQDKDTTAPLNIDPRVDSGMMRTAQDTLTLTTLVDEYLSHVQDGDYDAAVAMLSYYNDSTAQAEVLPDTTAARMKMLYRCFPIESYTIDKMALYSETDTEVRYSISMFEQNGDCPNRMHFMLSPKRIDGKWVLCVGKRDIIR